MCLHSKAQIMRLISDNIKLTAIDLNSLSAAKKGYSQKKFVLETTNEIYYDRDAWYMLIGATKYRWMTHKSLKPIFNLCYYLIAKNRTLISKIFKVRHLF